jgi:hypothetical protein
MADIVYPDGYDPASNPAPLMSPTSSTNVEPHPLPEGAWKENVVIHGNDYYGDGILGTRGESSIVVLEDEWGGYYCLLEEAESEEDFHQRVADTKEFIRLLESLDLTDEGQRELDENRSHLARADEIYADLKPEWDEYAEDAQALANRCNGYLDTNEGVIAHYPYNPRCPKHPFG